MTDSLLDNDPAGLADESTVRALIDEWGYHPEKVKGWTQAHAATVLRKRRREAKQDVHHGDALAAQQPDAPAGGIRAGELLARLDAAAYLEQALRGDSDALLFALTYAMFPLTQTEMREYARLLVMQLRLHPLTGDPVGMTEAA